MAEAGAAEAGAAEAEHVGPTDLPLALAAIAFSRGETSIEVREARIDETLALVREFKADEKKDSPAERADAVVAELAVWCSERKRVLQFLRSNPHPFEADKAVEKMAEWVRFKLDYPFMNIAEARPIFQSTIGKAIQILDVKTVSLDTAFAAETARTRTLTPSSPPLTDAAVVLVC